MSATIDAANDPASVTTDTESMLRAELRQVRGIADQAITGDIDEKLRPPVSALCFSGGGIRSAAFNLGVARALAKFGLLKQIDYLSTVSGGGYIGSWLQVLIKEQLKEQSGATHAERLAEAERLLVQPRPDAVRKLRDFGNFLTPRVGMGSPDTWGAVVLYLRNMLLNWAVLAPVLLLAVLAPIFHRTATWQAGTLDWLTIALVALAWVGLCGGVFRTSQMLPTHQAEKDFGEPAPSKTAVTQITAVALAWAMVAPVLLQHLTASRWQPGADGQPFNLASASDRDLMAVWLPLPVLQAAAMLLGYGLAWALACRRSTPGADTYRANVWRWCAATFASAVLLAIAIRLFLPWLAAQNGDTATLLTSSSHYGKSVSEPAVPSQFPRFGPLSFQA
ncbi:MAG: hypothetical protein EXR07_16240 [Acetobacteraceae bacterium]|nr:hypothetical protein [Acetobacteraceae bacterium]